MIVTGQNAVCYDQFYDLFLVRTLCYNQVYDLLLPVTIINLVEYNINTAVKLYVTITYRNMAFWKVTNHKLDHNIQCSDQ
jgi:hypothetical protein